MGSKAEKHRSERDMKPKNIFTLISAVSAGYKTYVGTDKSAAYPIYCDELKSEIESFNPSFSQEGPAISVDNGKAIVNGFMPDEYLFLTTYDCTMKGGRTEKVLLSAILEPTDVKVITLDYDIDSKKSGKAGKLSNRRNFSVSKNRVA